MKARLGYIHIYTGNGKGKTTASLGLTLRALGRGLKVAIIQFMKKGEYGELIALKKFRSLVEVKQFGTRSFVKDKPTYRQKDIAQKGVEYCIKILQAQKYDIVVLDELCCALKWKLINREDVEKILFAKPSNTELIITGRYAPKWLIEKAHLVSKIKEIKHYYKSNVYGRKGIEY